MDTFDSDLRDWLAAQGAGTTGTDLFCGQLPPDAVNAILIVPTGGMESLRPTKAYRPSVQVTARNLDYAAARSKIFQVHGLLNELKPTLMGSTLVGYVKAIQPPLLMQQDEQQAWRWVCNFKLWVSHP